MRALLVVAFCAVYSVKAWNQDIGPVYIQTQTGQVPPKYFPLTADDKHATRKAGTFVNFIKIVPQLNPLRLPSLGPYNVAIPELNFQGDLHLSNIAVNGIKSFSLSHLEVRMAPPRIDFNASLPQVSADVNFELQAVLGNQPLNVNGQVSATLQGLSLSAAVGPKVAQLYNNQVYQVDSADVNIDLKDLQVNMNMNQHAEEFRTILVNFLHNPQQHAAIVDDLLRAVLKAINHELTQITAKEILQYLLGSARPSLSG